MIAKKKTPKEIPRTLLVTLTLDNNIMIIWKILKNI